MSREPKVLDIYLSHRSELVNYASNILGDRANAEDVVQEAYLRFDAAATDRPLREPLSYLYRIVRNLSLDIRRRAGRDRDRLLSGAEMIVSRLHEERPSPEAAVATKEELRLVNEAIAELPDRTRLALEMHRFSEYTFRQIADELGVSVGLAHSLVAQGIEHCQRKLFGKQKRRKP